VASRRRGQPGTPLSSAAVAYGARRAVGKGCDHESNAFAARSTVNTACGGPGGIAIASPGPTRTTAPSISNSSSPSITEVICSPSCWCLSKRAPGSTSKYVIRTCSSATAHMRAPGTSGRSGSIDLGRKRAPASLSRFDMTVAVEGHSFWNSAVPWMAGAASSRLRTAKPLFCQLLATSADKQDRTMRPWPSPFEAAGANNLAADDRGATLEPQCWLR